MQRKHYSPGDAVADQIVWSPTSKILYRGSTAECCRRESVRCAFRSECIERRFESNWALLCAYGLSAKKTSSEILRKIDLFCQIGLSHLAHHYLLTYSQESAFSPKSKSKFRLVSHWLVGLATGPYYAYFQKLSAEHHI